MTVTEIRKTKSDIDQGLKLNRSRKNLRRDVGKAIADYTMIEDGDKVMVCLSGGKDSYVMLDILLSLQKVRRLIFLCTQLISTKSNLASPSTCCLTIFQRSA